MSAAAGARPNILVLLTDEEREPIWVPDGFTLPARERLDARGLRISGHHIHAQPCTPSRSTMVTGRHVADTAMADNINFGWQDAMRPPTEGGLPTWATMLAEAGYRSAWLGKWHLGNADRRAGLTRFGFDDWSAPDVHGVPWAGHLHDRLTARHAERWLARHAAATDQPWLLVVSFVNPHDIWLYPRFRNPGLPRIDAPLPATLHDDLADKPEVHRRWREVCDLTSGTVRDQRQWQQIADAYLGLQLEVDAHLGRVLDALDRSGVAASTVVVRTSDHGDMAGAHGLRQKGPFVYREAVNVPLTIAWPGRTDDGATSAALTAAVDLAPTLCAIGGLDAHEVTERWGLPGRSLLPLLDDPAATVRDEVLFTADAASSMGPQGPMRGFLRGCTDGRWKVARYFEPGAQHAPLADQDLELYDLDADPFEARNLAADPAHAADLAAALARLEALIARELGDDDVVPRAPDGVSPGLRLLFAALGAMERRHRPLAATPAPSPEVVHADAS